LWANRVVGVHEPRSRDPFGLDDIAAGAGHRGHDAYAAAGAGSGRGVHGPFAPGYVNPYAKDPKPGKASSLDASRGPHGPFNPKSASNAGLPRAITELDAGVPPENEPSKRELERLQTSLVKEIPKVSDEVDKKDAEQKLKEVNRELDKKIKAELNGGGGLLGMADAFKLPIQFKKQFHPRVRYRSPTSRGQIPKTQKKKWKKLMDKLYDTKLDLDNAQVLNLPKDVAKYKQKAKELRKKIAKIPTLFEDRQFLGGRSGDSWDDLIPEAVVNGVYRSPVTYFNRPEGEPVSDFMHNGWDGLDGVADP